MTCHFCSSPCIGKCSWPVERFVVDEAENIRPGDMVRRFIEKRTTANRATVQEIATAGPSLLKITLRVSAPKKPARFKEITANVFSRLRVLRTVPCEAPVCEGHTREVGPGRLYCKDHWMAWERAA